MKGDNYKKLLTEIISDIATDIENGESGRARSYLNDLRNEFKVMPHCSFAGGRSIFAILYAQYVALESKYKQKFEYQRE